MTTTAEIVNFAEQRELRRIQSEVMHANRRIELTHIRLACRVIDEAKLDREIASVLDELAQLRRDLELAIERWPSNVETRNVQPVN